jgi:hypothetical protein
MRPFDRPVAASTSFDFSALIELRRQHETQRAAEGVRVKNRLVEAGTDVETNAGPTKSEMVKKQIKREMNAVLREHSQKAIGTGLERQARWRNSSAPGGRSENEVSALTGNSANAELAAGQRAAAVSNRIFFRSFNLMHLRSSVVDFKRLQQIMSRKI